jgi:hypothetical protein
MRAKTAMAIVISITILFVLLVTQSKAEEVLPATKPLHVKVQGWVEQEWIDIKQYQTQSWEDGKEQLAKNKDQLIGIWNKLTSN